MAAYTLPGYQRGVNLGHFLSQYGNKSDEHFSTYITEPDLTRIASWGLDHVRLPIDYFLFEDDADPGVYNLTRVAYIDRLVDWCEKAGLNIILDLHHAPGFFFGNGDRNTLFTDEAMQERFLAIWDFFAKRYGQRGHVAFELLNELVADSSDPWNALWTRAAARIRESAPDRYIIVGGNYWNSVGQLKDLTVSDDPKVVYTFHFYQPMIFSHQRAPWMKNYTAYTTPVDWPFVGEDHAAFFGGKLPGDLHGKIDRDYLSRQLEPAREFIEKNRRPLYCGECGVISYAPLESQKRWYADVVSLFNELGIGRAVWSYRGFASLTTPDDRVTDEELVRIIAG